VSFARAVAASYFAESENGFWRWAEDGAVLVWQDGTTLAFREELIGIVSRFTTGSPPPLEGLVLLLAACRGKVPTLDDVLRSFPEAKRPRKRQASMEAFWQEQLDVIRAYAELPPDLLVGVEAKAELAWLVFEAIQGVEPPPSMALVAQLFENLELLEMTWISRTHETFRLLQLLAAAIKGRGPDELRRRLRTGLDALPVPAPVELPPAERWRRFWDELARHQELAGLAALARDAMAALRLPRRLGVPDTGALAGVADLSNRGSLDRLLLSELAHDDEVLTSRLALNEALYLRREPPAMEPPGSFAVLLDSGVRMWGLPRVFAVAVALAAAQKEPGRRPTRFWRAHGEQVVSVELDVVAGLEAHLSVLETGVHPGAALAAFDAASSACGDGRMVLVLTHRDFLSDPEFRRALAETPALEGFLGVVDRDGHFALHELPLAKRAPYCEARLDLGGLLADAEAGRSLAAGFHEKDLPAIFRVRPFPLLLPVQTPVESFWPNSDGAIAVMRDRRLLAWERPGGGAAVGARQLAVDLPRGQTLWARPLLNDRAEVRGAVLLRHHRNKRRLWLVRIESPESRPEAVQLPWDSADTPFVRDERAVLLIASAKRTLAVEVKSGQVLANRPAPAGWRLVHGRHFYGLSGWGFVAWDGADLQWLPLDLPREIERSEVFLVFDAVDATAPYVLTRQGAVHTSEGRMIFDKKSRILHARTSRDGARLLLQDAASDSRCVLDLATGKAGVHPVNKAEGALNPAPELPRMKTVGRIVALNVAWPESILLQGSDGRFWRLRILNGVAIELLAIRPDASVAEGFVPLAPLETPPQLGCQLDVVRFASGTRIFHDSRGLLHLKSHDASVPDLTLVLGVGVVKAWVEGDPDQFGLDGPAVTGRLHWQSTVTFKNFLHAR
jgi:hypothetical protein